MTIIKKCYLDNRNEVTRLLNLRLGTIDDIDNLLFNLGKISQNNELETQHFNSGQFINLCNFYSDICVKTTELAKNKLKATNNVASPRIKYGFDEEYMVTVIFTEIKKYALCAMAAAEDLDSFLEAQYRKNNKGTKDEAETYGIAMSKNEVCMILAASVFGLTNGVSLLNYIINNDVIPFTCLLEYFNRRIEINEEDDNNNSVLVLKRTENDITEKTLNKMCNLILAANGEALPRVMLFVADTSLYSSVCYNQIHHINNINKNKAISYESNKNLEMPEIIVRDILRLANDENLVVGSAVSTVQSAQSPQSTPNPKSSKLINHVFGAEYYCCIKPSRDVSIKHQMYGVGAVHDKFPRTTDGTVARSIIFDETNPAFFRSTQKQTNVARILNYFDIFAQRIHFYRTCCSKLFIDTPQNSICVSVNPAAIKHIQIMEFFAVLIAAGLEGRDVEFHTGSVDTEDLLHEDNSQEEDESEVRKKFGEQFLDFMQKCRKNRVSIADLYTAILEFIKKIKRDVNNGYGEFDLMKVSFFDVI